MMAEAYRGYLIYKSPYKTGGDTYWVEKDKILICWATSREEARQKIDELLS